MELTVIRPGRISYKDALEWQYDLMAQRKENKIKDTLLLLEHEPVLTTGRRPQDHNILIDTEKEGVQVIKTNRGGEVTYHGPGQVIGYLITDLSQFSRQIKKFVTNLEQVFIDLLQKEYGIEAYREPKHRGVWVDDKKITALGLAIEKEITMHGFAFNINTNLEHFNWIVPCGINDKGVCSLESLTRKKWPLETLMDQVTKYYVQIFGYDNVEVRYGRK